MFARTDRLLLRPGWAEDSAALARALADRDVVRNLRQVPTPPLCGQTVHASAQRLADEPQLLILRRTMGAPHLIGSIAITRGDEGHELGFWIVSDAWGLGYATEAAQAMVALARDSLRLPRLIASQFLDNAASARVLAKVGFRALPPIEPVFSEGRGETLPCRRYVVDLAARRGNSRDAMPPLMVDPERLQPRAA